jgi:hypothetical protein
MSRQRRPRPPAAPASCDHPLVVWRPGDQWRCVVCGQEGQGNPWPRVVQAH